MIKDFKTAVVISYQSITFCLVDADVKYTHKIDSYIYHWIFGDERGFSVTYMALT